MLWFILIATREIHAYVVHGPPTADIGSHMREEGSTDHWVESTIVRFLGLDEKRSFSEPASGKTKN